MLKRCVIEKVGIHLEGFKYCSVHINNLMALDMFTDTCIWRCTTLCSKHVSGFPFSFISFIKPVSIAISIIQPPLTSTSIVYVAYLKGSSQSEVLF